ncbi:MAG TPA: DUF5615 family PIN-like protein [Bryobacteraceae bacterium]|jgi:hypothetical protein|nr:DUF5615 family PIN-like protein [Bryobacteraceae bacterium]
MVESDQEIMRGVPVYKGTRILVHTIADMLSQGATVAEILEGYPALTRESRVGADVCQGHFLAEGVLSSGRGPSVRRDAIANGALAKLRKFLIDECLHTSLVTLAHEAGHLCDQVNFLGLGGHKDWQLTTRIRNEDYTFVTNNRTDFTSLYARERLHSGLVIILPNVIP